MKTILTKPVERPIEYFKVIIAGKKIEIECQYRYVFRLCRHYLAEFDEPDYVISASESEIYQESRNIPLPDYGVHYKNVAISPSMDILESSVICHKIAKTLADDGIILIHGAAVAVNDKCYIFTAPSGTGKTTHILNWLGLIPGSFVVNGDKPLVDVIGKQVYGTPWSGKENMNTNTSVPLAGIIALERGERNFIHEISFLDMFPYLFQQCYIPKEADLTSKVLNLISKLNDVRCFRLICNTEKESALVSYKGLNG